MISGNTNTAMIPTMRAAIDRLDAGLAEAVSRMDQVMDRVRGSQPAVNSLDKIASESAAWIVRATCEP